VASTPRKTMFDSDVAAVEPTQFPEARDQSAAMTHAKQIVRATGDGCQIADAAHVFSLLRAYCGRDQDGRPSQQHEVASSHSITSSARWRSDCGTVRPSTFAVFRLIAKLNFVGSSTGMSAGFAPLKILSTTPAARNHISFWSAA